MRHNACIHFFVSISRLLLAIPFHYKWKRASILAISETLLEKFIKNDR